MDDHTDHAENIPDSAQSVKGPANEQSQLENAPVSKSARKKAAKAERFAAYKLGRRAKEREARKEKKKIAKAKREAGELDENEEHRSTKRQRIADRTPWSGRVIVDLGFDELMRDKEISSLTSQLAYTYSANRNDSFPFSLLFTGLSGRTFARLEGMNDAAYKRWVNTEWWMESYERLWRVDEGKSGDMNGAREGGNVQNPNIAENMEHRAPEQHENADIKESVIYLTADSEEELTELAEGETYIIGGICDHNRYKNLCLKKANAGGVRTARLPIGRYLASLPTRKVLTVNQVFEILLKWVETRDWETALYSVIPKRKFQGTQIDKVKEGKGKEPAGQDEEGEDMEEYYINEGSTVVADETGGAERTYVGNAATVEGSRDNLQ